MAWSTANDATHLLTVAGDFLRSRPAEHSTLLSVTERLRRRGATAYGGEPALLGWWSDGAGAVGAVFLHTPPYPVLLSPAPQPAVTALARLLADAGRQVGGVSADEPAAVAFAAEWLRSTGAASRVHQRHRLHRLGVLTPQVPGPPGGARPASAGDRGLLFTWHQAFTVETGGHATEAAPIIDDRIADGKLLLWEVGGEPVSMAGVFGPTAGAARIGPVYTPRALRGRGYAAAVTAAASRAALGAGASEVLLYTDLANPTSNALYRRLGYRPLGVRVELAFAPPEPTGDAPQAARQHP